MGCMALCESDFTRMILLMKHLRSFMPAVLLAALAAVPQVVVAQDPSTVEEAVTVETERQILQRVLTDNAPAESLPGPPSPSAQGTVFRDIPSISGHYAVRGRTVMPYVGLGFGGGYTSDLNRSLAGSLPVPTEFGLRSQFGQGLSPNEFQMGLRIPF